MSRGPRNSPPLAWQPSANLAQLRERAVLLAEIRRFFAERGVLEVETPLLASAPVTDPHLDSFSVLVEQGETQVRRFYLQTSPEFAMKRLLAAGVGPIYQLGKAFRAGEHGRKHNPEFTLLEWYRPGFDHHALMDEVEALLQAVLGVGPGERLTYAELFGQRLGIDPHRASVVELAEVAAEQGLDAAGLAAADRNTWLELLLSHLLEPSLGRGRPTFLFDFPVTQAALARIRPGDPPVGERFEVYVEGIELANGFHELQDADEQRRRFHADLAWRRAHGRPLVPLDERLLAALTAGLPACAGVALGVDRLALLRTGTQSLADVMAFAWDRV